MYDSDIARILLWEGGGSAGKLGQRRLFRCKYDTL